WITSPPRRSKPEFEKTRRKAPFLADRIEEPGTKDDAHARNRLPPSSPRDRHAARARPTGLRAYEPLGQPTARTLPGSWFKLRRQSVAVREPGRRTGLLPQMPQPRKPTGAMGRRQPTSPLRGRPRPLPRPRT